FFAGRLEEKKGVFEAIQVAQATNSKLLIAGSPSEGKYWDEKIAPHLNDKIRYIGLVPYNEIARYFRNAKAFLFPILWEEPFGLVMAEAMAAGTPVIAFNRGSVPEVVVDGKTGFIVKTVEEMAEAIRKIGQIDRRECRKHVEDNFSVEKMVDGYERAFLKILNENKFFLQKRK
ncbi:MAG: glycosyltransferase, partial [Patescibacteria group bacterium]